MKVDDVATPDASVVAEVVAPVPAKVPLAPDAGAVNVTVAPATGFPPESCTVATRGLAKAVLIWALWPPPEVAEILAAEPAALVNGNDATPGTPGTDALAE